MKAITLLQPWATSVAKGCIGNLELATTKNSTMHFQGNMLQTYTLLVFVKIIGSIERIGIT